MYDGICKGFSDGFVLWGVIHSLDAFHPEWSWKVCRYFGYHSAEELIEIVFPATIVCKPVTVTFITDEIAEIDVVHSEIGKPFLNGQTLAEHHQSCHRKTFFARCPVNDITTKILKERFVIDLVVEHIRKIESGEVRTAKKEKYAEESIKNWKQFRRVFLDVYKIKSFEWDDINEALADRYISYLESVGYMKYTLDKHISLFKTIVGVAERQGLHNNHLAGSYLKSPQIREEYKAKEIYLTKDELSALYDMPLNGFEEQVRDVFLIGCFTALRYSDYSRIKKENIGFYP